MLDTETSGLTDDDEIIQIAITDLDGNCLLNQLINPTCDIYPEAQAVHGISLDLLEDASTFKEVYPDILEAIKGKQKPNFGLEIREYLDLLFDNCIDFKLFQCYMSPYLPQHITTRGKYVMHLVGQHIVIEYDRPTNFLSHTKHDYIASTLIRDEPLF